MNGSNITQDFSDDDEILVINVIKPNLVTPNKAIATNISNVINTVQPYDKDWTGFKRTCKTAFT